MASFLSKSLINIPVITLSPVCQHVCSEHQTMAAVWFHADIINKSFGTFVVLLRYLLRGTLAPVAAVTQFERLQLFFLFPSFISKST